MKSNPPQIELTFNILHGRLLEFVLGRVNNGDFTERGLARILSISQPQMHNVLKGNRTLTPALADRIMQRFGLSVVDLLHKHELMARSNAESPEGASTFQNDSAIMRNGPSRPRKEMPIHEDLAS